MALGLLLLAQAAIALPAADADRRFVLAEWEAPGDGPVSLRDAAGGITAAQREGKRVRWLVREIPAGVSPRWTVEEPKPAEAMRAKEDPAGFVSIHAPGAGEVTRLYFGEPARQHGKPFFYPLVADGVNVLRGHPIETRAGEKQDHPHHVGIFHAHGDVAGKDHWSSREAVTAGKPEVEAGPACVRLQTVNRWTAGLVERQDVRVLSAAPEAVIDFTLTLTAEEGPVVLGKTKEGSFAARLTTGLTNENGGKVVMTDSKGHEGEPAIRGDSAPWVHYSGTVDGKRVGVAMMTHPSGFRAPSTWHVRGYGLLAANPYYVAGAHTLAKGESITMRWRVYAHAGERAAGKVEAVYAGYAGAATAR
jgi:hypothetical protein